MKPPVKSLLSFKSRSQAPGWIIFGAEYIRIKFQTEEFRFWQRLLNELFINFSTYYSNFSIKCQAKRHLILKNNNAKIIVTIALLFPKLEASSRISAADSSSN